MVGKQWNELQKEVPTAHPGTFEIAPKDKNVKQRWGQVAFLQTF